MEDDDGLPEDECDHMDYDVDILTGRATCERCGHRWYQTDEQRRSQERAQAAWDRYCAEQERADAECD